MRFKKSILCLVPALLFSSPAFSFDFSVTDNAASCTACDPITCGNCSNPASGTVCPFQEALNIASCNGEDDTIILAAGNYDPSTAAPIACTPAFCYNGAIAPENSSLSILGAGAGQTVIDCGNQAGVRGLDCRNFLPDDSATQLVISGISFQNCLVADFGGGLNVMVVNADVVLEGNEFVNNEALGAGAAFLNSAGGHAGYTLNRNFFFNNRSTGSEGGAVFANTTNGTIVATNNVVAGNTANGGEGGGFSLEVFHAGTGGVLRVINNTFFNNTTGTNGGGFIATLCGTNTVDIYNNIVYQNTAVGQGADIYATTVVGECLIADGALSLFNNDFIEFESALPDMTIAQGSNRNEDPLWVDSAANNFYLQAGSPMIDVGTPNPPGGLPTPDFDGVTRPQGPLPDLGALEFIVTPFPSASPTPSVNPDVQGSGCRLVLGNKETESYFWFFLTLPGFLYLRKFFRERV